MGKKNVQGQETRQNGQRLRDYGTQAVSGYRNYNDRIDGLKLVHIYRLRDCGEVDTALFHAVFEYVKFDELGEE